MKVPVFRAKDLDSNEYVEGFYCEYPVTSISPNISMSEYSNVARCLLTYRPGMMGIVNEPVGCTVDVTTMEFVKYVDIPCKGEPTII